jgi:hypothetical protein
MGRKLMALMKLSWWNFSTPQAEHKDGKSMSHVGHFKEQPPRTNNHIQQPTTNIQQPNNDNNDNNDNNNNSINRKCCACRAI